MFRLSLNLPILLLVLAGCTSAEDVAGVADPIPEIESAAGLTLPEGFTATLFADGMVTNRHIVVGENGDVYTTIRSGQAKFRATDEDGGVRGFRDTDGDGVADEEVAFGTPDIDTGLGLYDGHLYYSSMTTIYASELGEGLAPAGPAEVVVADMPQSAAGHRTKVITFDSQGNLYTQVGSPSNACEDEDSAPAGMMPCTQLDQHGGVFVFDASARDQVHAEAGRRYSSGHRNIVALEWNASAGALYGLMHGRDGLSGAWPDFFSREADIEIPAEEFHRIDEGDNLGWPYTYYDPIRGERMVSPEYGGDGETPAQPGMYEEPLIAFPGHWAPNDIVFYTGTQFPERYRNGAFIAFHGPVAPRREEAGGYNVVFVPMNADGEITGEWEIFADDFEIPAPGTDLVGRPSGLAVGPDGALYIGDDSGGRIWKVTYTGG